MDNTICGITLILPRKVQYTVVQLEKPIGLDLSWLNNDNIYIYMYIKPYPKAESNPKVFSGGQACSQYKIPLNNFKKFVTIYWKYLVSY